MILKTSEQVEFLQIYLKTVIIDSYGSKMPLTQLSNINNIDNMTLSINIWDGSLVKILKKIF